MTLFIESGSFVTMLDCMACNQQQDDAVIMADIFVGQAETELDDILQEFELGIHQDDAGADMEGILESWYDLTETEMDILE